MIFSKSVLLTKNFLHGLHGFARINFGNRVGRDYWRAASWTNTFDSRLAGTLAPPVPSVLIGEIRVKFLFHDERALVLLRLGGQATAQVFDDLFLHFFAARAPASRSGELLDAAAQSTKAQNTRGLTELLAQFV